jgi:hypothetical protein
MGPRRWLHRDRDKARVLTAGHLALTVLRECRAVGRPVERHRVLEIGAVEPCKEMKGQRISDVCLQSNLSRDGCGQPVEVQMLGSGSLVTFNMRGLSLGLGVQVMRSRAA